MSSNGFVSGGVGPNPDGYSVGAPPLNSGSQSIPLMYAMAAMAGKGSSSKKFSSTNSNVSIVKYDDFFDQKDWCLENLEKSNGDQFTEEELDKNPVLGVKFEGCDILFPIPSHKSIEKTQNQLILEEYCDDDKNKFAMLSEEIIKRCARDLSEIMMKEFVGKCGHGYSDQSTTCFMRRGHVYKEQD